MESFQLFVDLGEQFLYLTALLYIVLQRFQKLFYKQDRQIRSWAWGGLFGIFAAICILSPVSSINGVLIDGRLVFVALSGLFGGIPAALITCTIALSLRIVEGGAGMHAGVGAIFFAFLLSLIFNKWVPILDKHTYTRSVLLGLLLTADALFWTYTLSYDSAWKLIPLISSPLTLLYPAALVLFIVLIRSEWKNHTTQAKLAESEDRYRTIVESFQDFVYSFDLSGKLISANANMLETLNLKTDKLKGNTIADILKSQTEKTRWLSAFKQVIETEQSIEFETRLFIKEIPLVYSVKLSPIYDESRKLSGVLGIHREITEMKNKEKKIQHLAFHDSLTDLPNRVTYQERLSTALEQATLTRTKVAVAFLDLDHFKQINDTMGHAAGDEVLIWVSRTLKTLIRPQDTMARVGGDEFTFIFPMLQQKDDIVSIIRRMQEALNQPVLIREKLIHITGSFGIAFYPDDAVTKEDLLKQADTAMYFAKRNGQNDYATTSLQSHDGSA
jgi:diguanylate cyclase (GGDEF)-like protein/PAS domain S-box-containing protein